MPRKKKAVALKYNLEQDLAPVVIASGYGEVAERIINIAEERGIPVYRDDSAASMLCMLEVGASIPEELYQVVATIYIQIMETANRIKEGTTVGAALGAAAARAAGTQGAAQGADRGATRIAAQRDGSQGAAQGDEADDGPGGVDRGSGGAGGGRIFTPMEPRPVVERIDTNPLYGGTFADREGDGGLSPYEDTVFDDEGASRT